LGTNSGRSKAPSGGNDAGGTGPEREERGGNERGKRRKKGS
jgi:hypothetical protein